MIKVMVENVNKRNNVRKKNEVELINYEVIKITVRLEIES